MKLAAYMTLALVASTANAFVPVSINPQSTTQLQASRRAILEQAAGLAILIGSPAVALADSRPMYLTEPTEEFKANEAKAAEFKRQQLALKKKFLEALDKLLNEKDDEEALETDLNALRLLIVEGTGLPLGIKKDDLFKQIRTKKSRGYWPTRAEIA
jgi:hypothetical protein